MTMTTQVPELEKQPEEPTTTSAQTATKVRSNKPLIITLACVGAAILIAMSVGAVVLTHYLRSNVSQQRQSGITRRVGGRYMGGSRMSNRQATNVTRGVVLSVTSDGFTMAGNGKQYTVKTSSSTTYNGSSNSVAVNDSVAVSGDSMGGTITATSVNVKNQ